MNKQSKHILMIKYMTVYQLLKNIVCLFFSIFNIYISGARPASIFDRRKQDRTAYTKTDKSGYNKAYGQQ